MNAFRHTLAALLVASACVSGPAKAQVKKFEGPAEAQNPTMAKKFQGHGSGILGVAVSGDGKFVFTGSYDKTAILWDAATGKMLRTFEGHTEAVSGVAMSGDGKHVVTGSWDKSAILWDAANGKKLHTFQHDKGITSVALSRDGKHLVTGSFDKTAILWDKASGKKIRTFSQEVAVFGVAVNDDSTKILTGSSQDGRANLWDAATGKKLQTFKDGHTSRVMAVALSGDGTRVLTGSEDNTAILWDAASGKLLHTLRGGDWMVTSVALSRDGKLALSGQVLTKDVGAILWHVGNGQKLQTFQTHGNNVLSVALSDDGMYALTGSSDDSAILWKVRGAPVAPALAGDLANELAKLKTRIADLERELVLTKAALVDLQRKVEEPDKPAVKAPQPEGKKAAVSAKEPVSIESQYPVWEIVCSQDGMRLAVTGLARQNGVGTGTIRVLDIPTTKERFHLTDQNFPPRFAFAPDGKTLAVISAVSHSRGNVHIWDVGAGKEIRTLENDAIHGGLVFSPDSKTLISLSVDDSNQMQARGRIFLWDAATGKKRRDFEVPGAKQPWSFYQCALSPDGKKLAVHDSSLVIYGADEEKGVFTTIKAKGDSSLGIWDTATGKELARIKEHWFGFSDFVFAPDGQTLVTLGCLSTPIAPARDLFRMATVRIEGARIIDGQWYAGENSIVLRNANTGKEIRRFAEKRSEKLFFRHIALSADGKTLAGGGSDGVIYLWDVATGKEIQQLKNHQADLAQKDGWTLSGIVLAFTPDGRRLVSAANKRVLIWDMQAAGKIAGSLPGQVQAGDEAKAGPKPLPPGSPPGALAQDKLQEKELAALQGTWVLLRHEEGGKVVVDDNTRDETRERLIIKGDKVTGKNGETIVQGKVVLEATKTPKRLDLQFASGQSDVTIYVRAGDYLIQCGNRDGKTRPTEFVSGAEKGGEFLLVWKKKDMQAASK